MHAFRSSHINAVPHKSERTDDRHHNEPSYITGSHREHLCIGRHRAYHGFAKDRIQDGKQQADAYTPVEQQLHYTSYTLLLADRLADQGFAGIGKTVNEEGEEHKELHQDTAHRQFGVAILAGDRSKAHINDHETE